MPPVQQKDYLLKPSGSPGGQIADEAGSLVVSDFYATVGRNCLPGFKPESKFGRNPEIDIGSAPEDVWNGGGLYTGQPTGAPELVTVVSTSAADAAAGTGMQTIRFVGLQSATDTAESFEDVTLNGTTPVVSVNSWYRIYRAFGMTYGSGATNAGTITIAHQVTTANVFVSLPIGVGQTTIGAYTIPDQTTGQILSFHANLARAAGNAGSAFASLLIREFGTGGYNSKRSFTLTNQMAYQPPWVFPIIVPAQADILVRVEDVSDNDTQIAVEFDILLTDQ